MRRIAKIDSAVCVMVWMLATTMPVTVLAQAAVPAPTTTQTPADPAANSSGGGQTVQRKVPGAAPYEERRSTNVTTPFNDGNWSERTVERKVQAAAPVEHRSVNVQTPFNDAVWQKHTVIRTGKGAAPIEASRTTVQTPFNTGTGGGYTAGAMKGKAAVLRWRAQALQAKLIGPGMRMTGNGTPMGGYGGTPPYVPTGGGYNMNGPTGGFGGTPPYVSGQRGGGGTPDYSQYGMGL